MNALKEKLLKNSTLKFTSSLEESKFFSKKDMIQTPVPMINVALSGSVDGGIVSGLTMVAGQSKHFKSGYSLLLARSFLNKYPDGIILFYDSEFGTPLSYFTSFDVPHDQVVHSPIEDVEQFKFDIVKQLNDLGINDKVMIIVDSIGNLASRKEVEDAENGKAVADMSRAKSLKSLFRMITMKLTLKDIPMVVVNHTYKEIGLYPKDIVGGGTGGYYGSDNIWIISRRQDKEKGEDLKGYDFVINIEKSRYVKEKSQIPITIGFDNGINKWSGLFEIALEGQFITKPKNGWYAEVDPETGEVSETNRREDDMRHDGVMWTRFLKNKKFVDYIEKKYSLDTSKPIIDKDEDND